MVCKVLKTKTTYDPVKKIWSGPKKASPYGPDCSIGQVALEALLKDPDNISQICYNNGKQYTNQDIATLTIRCAQHFRKLGLKQCEMIGICASNSDYVAPLFFGAMLCGLTVSTLDPTFDKDGIKHTFTITKPRMMFCDGAIYETVKSVFAEINLKVPIYTTTDHLAGVKEITEFVAATGNEKGFVPEPLQNGASQIATILCSSGTTGLPKGVCISHESLLNSNIFARDNSDKIISFSTLYWLTGVITLLAGTFQGATRIISDKPFSTMAFFDIIEKYKVTVAFTPPSQMAMSVALPEIQRRDLSSVITYACGGSAVSHALVEKMKNFMTNAIFVVGYGMSEICGAVSVGESMCTGSTGQVVFNTQLKLIDDNGVSLSPGEVGEFCIKMPFKWAGYYANPDATKSTYDEDGWIHSGDLGYVDEAGNIFIIDRKKDIMKYNNFHFFPTEIEETIAKIPGVAELCVCGIPDDISTDLPTVAIVKEEGSTLTEDQVYNYTAERLAHFKHLRGGVYFIDSMPKTASGKNLRKKVRDICINLKNKRSDENITKENGARHDVQQQ